MEIHRIPNTELSAKLEAVETSFRELVSSSEPTEELISEAWRLYSERDAIREQQEGCPPVYNFPLGQLFAYLNGRQADHNMVSLELNRFRFATSGIGETPGPLFRGLQEEQLEQAKNFTRKMLSIKKPTAI